MSQETANKTPAAEPSLSKSYDPHAIEKPIYESWEKAGYFKPAGQGPSYCIMIPPPNVTGVLHMGHAFNQTIMDALIRYHRMKGYNTLWQPGTDHAGIATQMVVERQLQGEGKTRHDLGREKFIERVWEWKEESGGAITRQSRRMGTSMDWTRERFTMDEGLSNAVTEVFVRLYQEGLIYRGKRLVNWDPVLHTAVSDLEVISEEESGSLWHLRYPIVGTNEHLIVATTRPETMLGDTAVAVHPEDERYQKYIGKMVELPLTGRQIPIIADAYVEKEFGSGVVKITPAHDFNDYEVGKRHNLPLINIFDINAAVHLPGSPYHGLDRYKARKQIVADLEAKSLIEKIDQHKLMVPRGDRSNAVIEPYLTDQWYVKIEPLAKEAIKVVEDGRIKFVPENWSTTYYQWMNNIQDWCISRQIWWGHRIPAWYDAEGNIYVARNKADAYKQYIERLAKDDRVDARDAEAMIETLTHADADPSVMTKMEEGLAVRALSVLKQDSDVLDTWFSSALWPFSTLGWPEQTPELKTFYPTSVLVTGFDIIFFWVARMIMAGLKFAGDVPFKEVYIHGLVRDAQGQKMSKSKGNILDPLDLIDGIDLESLVKKRTSGMMQPQMAKKIETATRKEFPNGIQAFGTDALRFTFASLATLGRDIKFDLGRIEGYRNFCNKLWNAARYVLMNTEGQDTGVGTTASGVPAQPPLPQSNPNSPLPQGEGRVRGVELSAADRWIIARLNEVTAEVEKAISEYRFDLAAQSIYSFIWDEYCSWYLELSKVVLTDTKATPEAQRGTRRTLVQVLEASMRMLHPIMPFITEEIWQRVSPLCGDVQGRTNVAGDRKSGATVEDTIMLQPYPTSDAEQIDADAKTEMTWVMQVVTGIRNIRSTNDIAPGKPLPVFLADGGAQDKSHLERNRHYIASLARTESVTWLDAGQSAPESATALVGNMKVLIPLGSIINKEAELERLKKEMEKIEKELSKARGKLDNADFVARAPKQVVEQEQQRVKDFEVALGNLKMQHAKVAALPS